MTASEWAQPLIVMQDQAARIVELQAELARVTAERDRVDAINVEHCRAINTLLIDGSRWQARAEAAEAKVTRLVDAMERIKSRAMWVRGDQSYREFPKYVLNAVRDALSDIKGAKP